MDLVDGTTPTVGQQLRKLPSNRQSMLGPTHAQLLTCRPIASTLLLGRDTIWLLLAVSKCKKYSQLLQARQGQQLTRVSMFLGRVGAGRCCVLCSSSSAGARRNQLYRHRCDRQHAPSVMPVPATQQHQWQCQQRSSCTGMMKMPLAHAVRQPGVFAPWHNSSCAPDMLRGPHMSPAAGFCRTFPFAAALTSLVRRGSNGCLSI